MNYQEPEEVLVSIMVERKNVTKTWLLPKVLGIGVDVTPQGHFAMHCVAKPDAHGIPIYEDTDTKPENGPQAPEQQLRETMEFLRLVYGVDAIEDCIDWLDEHADEPTT